MWTPQCERYPPRAFSHDFRPSNRLQHALSMAGDTRTALPLSDGARGGLLHWTPAGATASTKRESSAMSGRKQSCAVDSQSGTFEWIFSQLRAIGEYLPEEHSAMIVR